MPLDLGAGDKTAPSAAVALAAIVSFFVAAASPASAQPAAAAAWQQAPSATISASGTVGQWQSGHWDKDWHDGRYGWWWVLSTGEWFAYEEPADEQSAVPRQPIRALRVRPTTGTIAPIPPAITPMSRFARRRGGRCRLPADPIGVASTRSFASLTAALC